VCFVGHIIGFGRHRPDDEELATISDLAKSKTKSDVRKMIEFFNYFHSYVPHLAELCVPFTNSLAKGKLSEFVWTSAEGQAFERLKSALCDCVRAKLYTTMWGKPFGIHCDSSKLAVGSCLVQWNDEGRQKPIAFASAKLSGAQLAWAAIEKEAFADSNPLTYSTTSAQKSAKLTRWILALQEFDIVFKYTKGRDHVVPDYLSHPN
jgi:RNase H-like domain found in reverse transcriptase